MTPRPNTLGPANTQIAVRLPADALAALRTIQATDGVPISEQVRRGVQLWLESKGVRTDRKRAGTRKRS